jgi:hypothetical protein
MGERQRQRVYLQGKGLETSEFEPCICNGQAQQAWHTCCRFTKSRPSSRDQDTRDTARAAEEDYEQAVEQANQERYGNRNGKEA